MAAVQDVELSSLRQSLRDGDNMAAALHSLETLLKSTSSSSRVLEIASFLSLPLLFETLSTISDDDEMLGLTCAILEKVFSVLPPEEVCRQRVYLELGLQHQREEVRRLCLEGIVAHLGEGEVGGMVRSRTVFHLVTQIVGDDNLHCSKLASDMLLSVLQHPETLDPSLKSGLLVDLRGLANTGDTVRFRVYDLVVRVSLSNEASFQFALSTGLLEEMVSELRCEDVLVQMNCVELVVQMMEGKGGAEFLETQGVLDTMHSLLLSAQSDAMGSIIVPSIFKYYGHISLSDRTDFLAISRRYPEFLHSILTACLSPEEETQWGVAVDTLGLLGSTSVGRAVLEAAGERGRAVVRSLGEVVSSGRSDMRVRALHSLSIFFSCSEERDECWSSEQYFTHLHPNILAVVMTLLRQPFDDLCTAALQLLRSLAPRDWGQRVLSQQPGLLEYLLDRRLSLGKSGKEIKYEIVSVLVNSSSAEGYFGSPNFLKLRKYHREGPFFATGEQALAMEDSAE